MNDDRNRNWYSNVSGFLVRTQKNSKFIFDQGYTHSWIGVASLPTYERRSNSNPLGKMCRND